MTLGLIPAKDSLREVAFGERNQHFAGRTRDFGDQPVAYEFQKDSFNSST